MRFSCIHTRICGALCKSVAVILEAFYAIKAFVAKLLCEKPVDITQKIPTDYIPIYIQQDETLHCLFISVNCSTCFGWYLHPSSGAHTTVSTASGTCQTVTATCRSRGRVGTASSSNSSTIAVASSKFDKYQIL